MSFLSTNFWSTKKLLCSDIIHEKPSLLLSTQHCLFPCFFLHQETKHPKEHHIAVLPVHLENSPPSSEQRLTGSSWFILRPKLRSHRETSLPQSNTHTSYGLPVPLGRSIIGISPLEPGTISAICRGLYLCFSFN